MAKNGMTMHNTPKTGKNPEVTVIRFRPRNVTTSPEKRAPDASNHLCELLDLSRYESRDRSAADLHARKDDPDDFNHRLRASVLALIFLLALAGLAAADVLKLEARISCPAGTGPCAPI
jgi:hypothetical protein